MNTEVKKVKGKLLTYSLNVSIAWTCLNAQMWNILSRFETDSNLPGACKKKYVFNGAMFREMRPLLFSSVIGEASLETWPH